MEDIVAQMSIIVTVIILLVDAQLVILLIYYLLGKIIFRILKNNIKIKKYYLFFKILKKKR